MLSAPAILARQPSQEGARFFAVFRAISVKLFLSAWPNKLGSEVPEPRRAGVGEMVNHFFLGLLRKAMEFAQISERLQDGGERFDLVSVAPQLV